MGESVRTGIASGRGRGPLASVLLLFHKHVDALEPQRFVNL